MIGVIDHIANPNSDTRATVEKFHRIDPNVVKADFKRAGFVFVGSSDLLRNQPTTTSLLVFDPKMARQDRPVHLQVQEAALTSEDREPAAEAGAGIPRLLCASRTASRHRCRDICQSSWRRARAAERSRVASFVGTLWLNALKMTVIPLVVALLVVGIAKSAEAAHAGRIAGRSVLWIVSSAPLPPCSALLPWCC